MGARALRVGPDGRLYASQPAFKRIVVYGPGGDEKVVAQNVEANDIAITAQAALYFTDAVHKTVGYIDAKTPSAHRLQRGRNCSSVRGGALPGPGHADRHGPAG